MLLYARSENIFSGGRAAAKSGWFKSTLQPPSSCFIIRIKLPVNFQHLEDVLTEIYHTYVIYTAVQFRGFAQAPSSGSSTVPGFKLFCSQMATEPPLLNKVQA